MFLPRTDDIFLVRSALSHLIRAERDLLLTAPLLRRRPTVDGEHDRLCLPHEAMPPSRLVLTAGACYQTLTQPADPSASLSNGRVSNAARTPRTRLPLTSDSRAQHPLGSRLTVYLK